MFLAALLQLKFCSPYCYHLITLQGVNSLHNNSHQRETVYDKLIFFGKTGKAVVSKI